MPSIAEVPVRCQSFVESAREPHERGHFVRLLLQNCADKIPEEDGTLLICTEKGSFAYINALVLHVENGSDITKVVVIAEQVPEAAPILQTLAPQRFI